MDKTIQETMDDLEEKTVSNPFKFSTPSVISDSPRVINFGMGSDHVFDVHSNKKNVFSFAFAAPMTVSQYNETRASLRDDNQLDKGTGLWKPKIARVMYKPTINVFASALKETGAFEQLKKNSRSHAGKIDINNSITCSNVPKALLTKAAAKEYFTKYGNIMKITIRPKRQVITVTYTLREEANFAYYSAGDYMNEKFHIEWTKLESLTKSPIKKKDSRKNIVTNLLKATDDEIKSELEAMTNLGYNLHSSKGTEIFDTDVSLPVKHRTSGGKTAHEKLTSKLEKAAVKIEKFETDSQIIKPLFNTSIEELQNIIHQVALTSEDKYKVLEARDRLMRLKRVKPASLATAKVTSGTCPDMCPEKERLMRESQRQVAPYEQIDGSEYRINHATAIKQYSRSSADQEEPMPHELRPVKSLKMTMSYLLHEIVNLCEQEGTNLAEWYHFLWDRTRGIRKDITQQELCCTDSVELIEQCARFHIVCSERLCAEDASVFDKKINSENLTKCLQTLKYMYHDLRVKDIACKNEPEFRAYIVLLNLNNGNFLYDLQQLPKSVQNSPEVQFAIGIYFALDSNNYHKFFKLVRQTTYLNACILLRYFNQVRVKAFSIMVKAYCRSTTTAFPLYELMDILCFEDENETEYFCEQVGLNLTNDKLHVLLNRRNFSMPTASIQQSRACNLIESKRIALNFSTGQCIAGGKMPDEVYKNHKPHNSFDAYGNLMPESINAADQNPDVLPMESNLHEFTGKEAKQISKSVWSQDKNQPAASVVQSKKQIMNNGSDVDRSVIVSESDNSGVFKTTIFESDALNERKERISNVSDTRPQLAARLNATSDKQPKEQEDAIVSTTHCENITTNNKQSVRQSVSSDRTLNNNPFTNNLPMQTEVSRNVIPMALFTTAANKNILSGTTVPKNMFLQNVMPISTVFSDNLFSVPSSKQQSANNASIANKVAMEQISSKEKQTQKDTQIMPGTEKVKFERLERVKKIQQQIEQQSEEIYHNLETEIIHEFCSVIAREDTNKIKMYDTLSEKITLDTIEEVTYEMCDILLRAEINNYHKLQVMLLKIKNRIILKCFNVWRQYTLKKKRQRQTLEDTPVWLQKQSVEECAKMLYSKEQDVVIRSMRKRRHEPEDATDSMEDLAPIELIIYTGLGENLRLLDINPLSNVFWKLVISWPDLSNKALLWHHKKIMNAYLCPDDFTMEPIVKVYRPNPYETVHICIRHFEGLISEHYLIGIDALFFIADAVEDYKSVAKRLTKTVLSRHKLMPIPLTFIILGDGNLRHQNENIVSDLESLLESGYLSEYTIMHEQDLTAKIILNLAQSTILWLAMNRSPLNPLEMDYLHNIYDTCLSEELWLRILGDSMFNEQLSNALKNPNFVIDLHNEAVNHLMDIIFDPESMLYTNFAPEFKKFLHTHHIVPCSYEYFDDSWKRDEYRANLETAMKSFMLPPWNAPWPITDVQNLRHHIVNYCGEVLSDSNRNVVFCDILSNFSFTSDNLHISNFVYVLLHVIKEKMHLLDGNQMVIYNRNHIKHFQTLPWWFKSNVLTEYMSYELNTGDILNKSIKKKEKLKDSDNNIDEPILDGEFDSLAKFCKDTKNRVMEVYFSSKDIENRLQVQHSWNTSLEEKLRNALLDEMDWVEEETSISFA